MLLSLLYRVFGFKFACLLVVIAILFADAELFNLFQGQAIHPFYTCFLSVSSVTW